MQIAFPNIETRDLIGGTVIGLAHHSAPVLETAGCGEGRKLAALLLIVVGCDAEYSNALKRNL